jgi:hypothetical protein
MITPRPLPILGRGRYVKRTQSDDVTINAYP